MEYQAPVYAPILNIGELIIDDANGNNNGRLDPGETATIKVRNYNSGHCPAENTVATLTSDCQYLTFSSNTFNLGTLGVFGFTYSEFEVEVEDDAPDGAAFAYFNYELVSGSFIETAEFVEKIGLIVEDWESGDFTKFEWNFDGDADFELTSIYPYEGVYSAKTGSIGDDESSELTIDVEVMLADSVTFVLKTSTQMNHDYFRFYINNSLQGEWSGVGTWQKVAFAVEPGNHTFKWVYIKDASGTAGSDCAWIDWITFPPLMTLTCYAGPDDQVCTGNDYQCQGEATNQVSVEWTSTGDGIFSDPYILDPVYTPGTNDMSLGDVDLTLTVEDADGSIVDDVMILSLIGIPEQPETPTGPDYVNVYTTTSSEYTTEAVPYANHYVWSVEPAEAGTIYGMETTGIIEWNSSFMGDAAISVKAVNSCGEGEFSSDFIVTVDNFTSINEIEQENSFLLWPNPNNGSFNIKATVKQAGDYSVRAFNMLGRELASSEGIYLDGANTLSIDFGSLPEGIYFVVIEGQGVKMIQKLIIH
jgi:hypothetical protein